MIHSLREKLTTKTVLLLIVFALLLMTFLNLLFEPTDASPTQLTEAYRPGRHHLT
jgi:hypothetical protein